MITRPIHHTFGPLADRRQARAALGMLRAPPMGSTHREYLRSLIAKDFGGSVTLFATGREALLALLRSLGIGNGDEVIVQAYTCIVVPNAIHATDAKTLYAEIEQDTLSMDPASVEQLISPKTRAIICQHTFGIPAPLSELRALCDRHQIPLIEDCAHLIPDDHGPAGIGRTGDFALFSLGRDKGISGVTGGAIVSHRERVNSSLRQQEIEAKALPLSTIRRLLAYPLLYRLARPFYGFWIGKGLLYASARLGWLPPIVTAQEKLGKQGKKVHALPEACARLAVKQWEARQAINDHRRQLTALYLSEATTRGWTTLAGACTGLPLQKFPLFVKNADAIRRVLKRRNIYLADGWTGCVVCPESVDASVAGYRSGTDAKAEDACLRILSLPTHPGTTVDDAQYLVAKLAPLLRS